MNVRKFREIPMTVTAVEYTGDNQQEIQEFLGDKAFVNDEKEIGSSNKRMHVLLSSGYGRSFFLDIGDFAAKGIAGSRFRIVKENINGPYKQYEEVES